MGKRFFLGKGKPNIAGGGCQKTVRKKKRPPFQGRKEVDDEKDTPRK